MVFEVFEGVLDAPPAAQRVREARGWGAQVAGQDLQHDPPVLIHAQLSAFPVSVKLDELISDAHVMALPSSLTTSGEA